MKTIDVSLSRSYPPVVLKLEDLEEIERIFSDAQCKLVSIKSEDRQFDSIHDLESNERDQKMNQLTIQYRDPWIQIELSPISSRLYASSNAPISEGVFSKVDKILFPCRRRPSWAYSSKFIFIMNALLWLIIKFVPDNPSPPIKIVGTIAAGLALILVFAWMPWAMLVGLKRHSVIHIVHRRKETSFLKRNQDQLLVALIGAVVGAILGIGGTLLVKELNLEQRNDQRVMSPEAPSTSSSK